MMASKEKGAAVLEPITNPAIAGTPGQREALHDRFHRIGAVCAISHYEALGSLTHVRKDEKNMKQSLLRNNFTVRTEHVIGTVSTADKLLKWLGIVFGSAPTKSLFFLHFCGHATRKDGAYILCTSEFDPNQPEMHLYTAIVDAKIKSFINNRTCAPWLVIGSFDACNEHLRARAFKLGELSIDDKPPRDGVDFVSMFGADLDEVAKGVEEHGGHYTYALCEAVSSPPHPKTLYDVMAIVQVKLPELSGESQSFRYKIDSNDVELLNYPIFTTDPPPSAKIQPPEVEVGPPDYPYFELPTKSGLVLRICLDTRKLIKSNKDHFSMTSPEELWELVKSGVDRILQLLEENKSS